MRLLTNARKEPFFSFRKIIGLTPRNIELYQLAVRHRSAPILDKNGNLQNNERLEFLGDAILNSIVSDILFRLYPKEKEGFLTNARSNIVKRETLNSFCYNIGLDKLIVVDPNLELDNINNIFGNAFEAIIGAIYLDAGYQACYRFIKKKVFASIQQIIKLAEYDENFKSKLFEWCQHHHFTIEYQLIAESIDKQNHHTFVTEIYIENKPICQGAGSNKKESHQQASMQALKIIEDNEAKIIRRLREKNQS